VGEAHRRQRGLVGRPGGGEAGEVAVGEREHRDVARRLAEIDRLDDVVEARACGGEEVHRLSPMSLIQERAGDAGAV
jgi:hypothetical protein